MSWDGHKLFRSLFILQLFQSLFILYAPLICLAVLFHFRSGVEGVCWLSRDRKSGLPGNSTGSLVDHHEENTGIHSVILKSAFIAGYFGLWFATLNISSGHRFHLFPLTLQKVTETTQDRAIFIQKVGARQDGTLQQMNESNTETVDARARSLTVRQLKGLDSDQ